MKHGLYALLSVGIIAFILGGLFGYYLTPQYQSSMYDKTVMDFGRPDKWVDARYINAMIAHHRGAMLLAEQAEKNGGRDEIKNLAGEILKNEPKLIEELYQWKELWYGDKRRVVDPVLVNLGNPGGTFDLRFLNALIAHHEDGIAMTKEIRTKSSREDILNNADAVESFLKNSGEMLSQWREKWYGIK